MSSEVEVIHSGSPLLAEAIKKKMDGLRSNLTDSMIDLAEVLHEVKKEALYFHWGYTRFDEWVEKGSELDITRRTAYYCVAIIEKSRKLGISKAVLKSTKMSKLREIFSLDEGKHGEEIKKLIIDAPTLSVTDIKNKVQKIEAGDDHLENFTFITLKIPESGKNNSFDPAIELARRLYGDVPNKYTGEIGDISISYAVELICANYIQDPNNYAEAEFEEEMKTEIIPVEEV